MEQELNNTWALMYKSEIIEKKSGNLSICICTANRWDAYINASSILGFGVGMFLLDTDKYFMENDQILLKYN